MSTKQTSNGQPLVYNVTPPTFSDGDAGAFECDANGNLKVVLTGGTGTNQNVNLAQVGGASVSLGQKASATSIPVTIASDQTIVPSSIIINPSANFTRPGDTTTYAVGDLVANSTTAGSVTPLSWTVARVAAGNFLIRRANIKKTTNTTALSSFYLHLYAASPTVTNGDNGAFLSSESTSLGIITVTSEWYAYNDPAAKGFGAPLTGNEISVALASGQIIYGLLEARAAYVPGNAEVFTVVLEVYQN